MGCHPQGRRESDTTEVTARMHACQELLGITLLNILELFKKTTTTTQKSANQLIHANFFLSLDTISKLPRQLSYSWSAEII